MKTPFKEKFESKPAVQPVVKDLPKPTADELAEALSGMVTEAEKDGDRDRPGVAKARELLARRGKAA